MKSKPISQADPSPLRGCRSKKPSARVLVFAKAPVPGEAKTRLVPLLGPWRAAALQEALALHCLNTAAASALGPVELWCAPSAEHPFFRECSRRFRVKRLRQADGDVGRRMAHAFEETLKKASFVLLMGTDCPSLTTLDLIKGFSFLQGGSDAVFSPAEDGGYVLIGLKRYAPELFSGISWGTESVMDETRMRLRNLGWQWHELPTRWDVDRPEDLKRLRLEGYTSFPF